MSMIADYVITIDWARIEEILSARHNDTPIEVTLDDTRMCIAAWYRYSERYQSLKTRIASASLV